MQIKNFKEYRELASVTDNPDRLSKFENDWHYLGGIFTELIELRNAVEEVNRDEEIGDVLWYLARYADRNNLDVDIFIDDTFSVALLNNNLSHLFQGNISMMLGVLSEIYNIEKRHMAYGDDYKDKDIEVCFRQLIILLRSCTNKSFQKICEANIQKLASRQKFAEKFNAHFGLHRDVNTEYNILENALQ